VVLPTLPELLRRLADALSTDEGPLVIDVNPRLVEPMNALLAGVDLLRLMLALASGAHPQAVGAGARRRALAELLLIVLGVANRERAGAVIPAFAEAVRGHGVYAGAIEIFNAAQGRSARPAAGHDCDGLDIAMPSLRLPVAPRHCADAGARAAIVKASEPA
jgi:hypothetical protein